MIYPKFLRSGSQILVVSPSEIVDEQLEKYHIPCLFDIDLGHRSSRMTFINGAYGIVDWDGKEGKFQQTLKKIAESIFFLLILFS